MLSKNVLEFLRNLQSNNNREWFNSNKEQYYSAKIEVESFIEKLVPEIIKFDNSISVLPVKNYMFRIFRDVRFSKDKSPYKTNFGAFINMGGRKSPGAGYYLHIEPENSFIGGGVHRPLPVYLKAVREEILYDTIEFKKIISSSDFKKYFTQIEGEKLSRPPKDFPKDFKDVDLLKYKSYTVMNSLSDDKIESKDLLHEVMIVLKAMYPFNNFLNRAINSIN